MKIKKLSEKTINRIAAGEVIERPLSVVKELVENSLDADATIIEIEIERGGRNLIMVRDNGFGIAKEDLALALERHATSKLEEDNIVNIAFHGFRGEALPSIASVSEMSVSSRARSADQAWQLEIKGGEVSSPIPARLQAGTEMVVKNLFIYTPNRLRFLKSESNELSNIVDIVERFAISHPQVSFKLHSNGKQLLYYPAQEEDIFTDKSRIINVMGQEFIDNALQVNKARDGIVIKGWVTQPTYSRKTMATNFIYVNKRIIRDKFFNSIIKISYQGLVPHDRHPQAILFLEIDPQLVDVNVHPTKAEVRFQDEHNLRGMIISAIRAAIAESTTATSSPSPISAPQIIERKQMPMVYSPHNSTNKPIYNKAAEQQKFDFQAPSINKDNIKTSLYSQSLAANAEEKVEPEVTISTKKLDLGLAKCQINNTFIIAENEEGLVIIDQHAAHERLVLERMKKQLAQGKLQSQPLLIPEIIELGVANTELLLTVQEKLHQFGIVLERNGITQVIVYEMPYLLSKMDIQQLLEDICDTLKADEGISFLSAKIEEILGNIACHDSIRAGRYMVVEEMNSLLREMENTPFSAQCNHGRPTFKKISLQELRKIFERS